MPPAEKGFTLLEVMIALFIFSIGILAVASMQIVGAKAVSSARQNFGNSISAVTFLEQVIGLDYHDPRLEDHDEGYQPDKPDHGPEPIGTSPSTIEWEVHADFPVPNSKRITITIRRMDPGGIERLTRYDYIKCLDFI
jgi:type IV pilus assembly protein PilV